LIGPAAGATNAMTYDDYMESALLMTNGGYNGVLNNPEDNIDTKRNTMSMAFVTTAAAATTTKATMMIDFAMVSIGWVEDSSHPTPTYQFTPTSGRMVRGAATSTQAVLAAAAEGVNMGSWKGTLADDNMHWVVMATTSVPSGFDVQLDMAGVNLNNANRFMIETGFDLDSANLTSGQVPLTYLQICDWVSSSGVNNPADSNCTTGGWRTLNMRNIPIVATSTENSLHYEIYDGYFSDGNNSSYSTPLANFINTTNSNTVTFRYYSDTQTNQNIAIDFLRMYAFISPTYTPAAAQAMINGSATNTPPGLWFQGPTTSNVAYDTDMNNQYIYTVGNNATPDWYIDVYSRG
jgi:hypothetical protein